MSTKLTTETTRLKYYNQDKDWWVVFEEGGAPCECIALFPNEDAAIAYIKMMEHQPTLKVIK